MSGRTLGLLHPGAMGHSVGAAARGVGVAVAWASEDRSEPSHERARRADLEDRGSLAGLARSCDVLLCVCPPHAAEQQARAVAALGFGGIYVDANAVAPETARRIAGSVESAGARFVDGGIVGPPAHREGTTRLYLSGSDARSVAALFAGSPLEAIPIPGTAGSASALKLCYAAYTKGSIALLTAIRSLAIHEGVDAELVAEWQRSIPDLPGRSESGARATAAKAWRFAGEMQEIAATFAAAGLPDGFHRAAAELYARLERYKDTADLPTLEEIANAVRRDDDA